MRLPKIVTHPWATLIVGFVAGVVCAGGIVGWYAWRSMVHAQVDANLDGAYLAAITLADLRTNTKAVAERHLEGTIDIAIAQVAIQSSFSGYGPFTTTEVEELSNVKYYRHAYPSTAPDAVATARYLAGFPDLHFAPEPGCNSGYCRIQRGEHDPDERAPAAH